MKLVPGPLPPIPTGANMDRLPLPIPFSPDFLWRYPLGFPALSQQQPPSSPLLDYKSQLPNSLTSDPRVWSREDVITFLRWAEREFDLQPFDLDNFQMNGELQVAKNAKLNVVQPLTIKLHSVADSLKSATIHTLKKDLYYGVTSTRI